LGDAPPVRTGREEGDDPDPPVCWSLPAVVREVHAPPVAVVCEVHAPLVFPQIPDSFPAVTVMFWECIL